MKKFNAQIEVDKNRTGSTWWNMILALTNNVKPEMVERKFSITRKDDHETIFDMVIRAGLASTFQEAVALLSNTFPPPPPPKLTLWQRLLSYLPRPSDRGY